MELKVFESPGKEWDEFASQYTDLIFYQSAWAGVLKKGLGGQPLYFFLKEGEQIIAGLPGVLLNFKIVKVFYASIPYGNLLGERSHFPLFMELLDYELRKRGIDQVRITESPFSEPFQPRRFKPISAKCTLLDLRNYDKEQLWKGYRKNVRRDIRKAQRSGVIVRAGSSKEDVRIFYRLYLDSMERNRAAAKYPFRWFESIYEELGKRQLATTLFGELNGVAIAGVILINSTTTTHYFHNGSQGEFLRFCPNELLIHSALEGAIEKGHSCFDFMGSDSNDLPLLRFKEKWGGQTRDICTHVRDYHSIRCRIWELGKRFGNSRLGSMLLRGFWDQRKEID
ncbi:MAG: peptidoglycan bridge formation glycyltransferase FemA/FemB family protein [Syntrophaceae bacterium]|nr:peptidoglycan bridge formation glycyltransferase FemA/FemB family protein [Syntrophaceae bacterium]